MTPRLKAVFFDIGGVVLQSPFISIAAYERDLGIPENYLNCSIVERGPQGAWQKFERGEMPLFEFYEALGHELSDTIRGNIWYKAYCGRKGIEPEHQWKTFVRDNNATFQHIYDPHVLQAICRIRAAGLHKLIALTNNFAKINIPPSELTFLGWEQGTTPKQLRELFDDFCDSSELGMRKPEPGFYLLACERNGLQPGQVIFLDDLGTNLKVAKSLGMETIHVPIGGTLEAMRVLEAKLGIDLTSPQAVLLPKL